MFPAASPPTAGRTAPSEVAVVLRPPATRRAGSVRPPFGPVRATRPGERRPAPRLRVRAPGPRVDVKIIEPAYFR